MQTNKSVNRDDKKNFKRGWSLISISLEPSLYLNVQVDGALFKEVVMPSLNAARRIGQMIHHLPITWGVEHEAFHQEQGKIWRGMNLIAPGGDRDWYRVQLPTDAAIRLLEQINSMLPSETRFEIYRGVGINRKDYTQKATIRIGGGDDDMVFDSTHGRYAVVSASGGVNLYEQHKLIETLDYSDGNQLDAVYEAMNWISYEPLTTEVDF